MNWLRNLFLRILDVLAALLTGVVLLFVLYLQFDTWLMVVQQSGTGMCRQPTITARNSFGQRYDDVTCDSTILRWTEACNE